MQQIQLRAIDYAILIVYFAFVLGIGWGLGRFVRNSEDFFLSGRSIPTWIAGFAPPATPPTRHLNGAAFPG